MPIIEDRMLDHLYNFYPSTATFQAATEVPVGTVDISLVWANKAGHVDLPARIGPSGGREIRQDDQTYAVSTHTIALRGNYPTVTVEDRVVDDNGVIYDILEVESDDQDASTYLYTEIVE